MRALLPTAIVTVILAAAVGQAGCEPQLTYVSEDHFAAEYAQALCTTLQPCCAENGVSYDYTACAAGWQAAVTNLLFGPNATGNYDTTVATACIAQVRAAQGASCQPGPGTLSAARATCQAIFAGEVPLGSPCTQASQCAQMDGSVIACAIVPGDAGGGGSVLPLVEQGVSLQGLTVSPENVPVCVVLPPDDAAPATPPPCTIDATAGTDTCISSGMYCASTVSMTTMMPELTCQPQSMAGGMCDSAVLGSCVPGNYCVSSGAMAGTCAAAGPVGSPCTAAAMCDSTGTCDVSGTQTCVAIKTPGQPCASASDCSIGVCDATTKTCLTNSVGTTAACNGVTGG